MAEVISVNTTRTPQVPMRPGSLKDINRTARSGRARVRLRILRSLRPSQDRPRTGLLRRQSQPPVPRAALAIKETSRDPKVNQRANLKGDTRPLRVRR